MTNRDVAVLGFKLVGLWLMAKAAIGVAGIPYYWDPQFGAVRAATVLATVLPPLVALGIGVPVWFHADWFASRIFPSPSADLLRLDRLRGEPVFALALSIIGVFLISEALPALVRAVAVLLQSWRASSTVFGGHAWSDLRAQLWDEAAKANALAALTRLAIGVAFLVGPARLSAATARFGREMPGWLTKDEQIAQTPDRSRAEGVSGEQADPAAEGRAAQNDHGPRS